MVSEVIWVSVITSITAIINTVINSRVTKKNIEKSETKIIDKAASKADVTELRDVMIKQGFMTPSESIPVIERRVEGGSSLHTRRRSDDLPDPKRED